MANKKITELSNLDTPNGADVLAIVDDIAGTATTKKVTATNLMTLAPVQSVAGRTGTVTLSDTDITGLGTAATQDVGTSNGNVVQLDGSGALPAVDGSNLTGITASVSAGELTDGNFDGTAILGFDASINDQTGTAYTLLASDNGKVVVLNNGSAVTVTVPSGLGVGFNCSFVQKGAGQVSFDNDSGATTINNRQSHTKINAQFGVASLVAYADNVFVLAGDTAS
jgi:hypothetical protein